MIEIGDPVVLKDASGLEDLGLTDGHKGFANSVAHVPGDKGYVFFMPNDQRMMHVLDISRVELDEEAKAAGIELNEATMPKGG